MLRVGPSDRNQLYIKLPLKRLTFVKDKDAHAVPYNVQGWGCNHKFKVKIIRSSNPNNNELLEVELLDLKNSQPHTGWGQYLILKLD